MENTDKQIVVAHPRRNFSLVPTSLGEAMELAKMIAASDFAPKDYAGKPANVIIAIQMGLDVGFSPMQALQNIAVINGKPAIYGDGMLALVMNSELCEDFNEKIEGEGPARAATCRTKRKGMTETVRTFSVADAKTAGLWGKAGPWQTYPDRMLGFRARSWALRDAFADILMGLAMVEEVQDIPLPGVIDVGEIPTEAPSLVWFKHLTEGQQESLEKAFTALNLGAGQRLVKMNEYMQAEVASDDERVDSLLNWCRDEYARRKTGQPVKRADNGKAPAAAPAAKPVERVVEGQVVEPVPAPAAVATKVDTLKKDLGF